MFKACARKIFIRFRKQPVQLASWCNSCHRWYQPFDKITVATEHKRSEERQSHPAWSTRDQHNACVDCTTKALFAVVKADVAKKPRELGGRDFRMEVRRRVIL